MNSRSIQACPGLRVSALALAVMTTAAHGQSLQQRIDDMRRRQIENALIAQRTEAQQPTARSRIAQPLASDTVLEMPARDAAAWISRASGVSLVINWQRLADAGIDGDIIVRIGGVGLTGEGAIDQLVRQLSIDRNLVWEVTPWYAEVITKDQANTRVVVMAYPMADLLFTVPDHTDAPSFDLTQITQASTGGGGGSAAGSLFKEQTTSAPAMTRAQKMEQIAQTIRQIVEPDLWRENGGVVASMSTFGDALVIRAPKYVHEQIGSTGIPMVETE